MSHLVLFKRLTTMKNAKNDTKSLSEIFKNTETKKKALQKIIKGLGETNKTVIKK